MSKLVSLVVHVLMAAPISPQRTRFQEHGDRECAIVLFPKDSYATRSDQGRGWAGMQKNFAVRAARSFERKRDFL